LNKLYSFITVAITISIIMGTINALDIIGSRQAIADDFEQTTGEGDIGEWFINGDVPQDPNNLGHAVQWHINRVSDISRSGMYSVELFIDGKQDDGTIWLERKISAKENSQTRVSVSFWLNSEQESSTIADVVSYAGNSKPTVEDDFTVVGTANEVAGWTNYSFTADLTTDSNGDTWVAVGISVRWETCMTYYIDDVRIEIA